MSNSKKFQRWVDQLIATLQKDYGLQLEEDRKNKYRLIKGNLNGHKYVQKFSSTPKSYTDASKKIINETKKNLKQCGIDLDEIKSANFRMAFSTYHQIHDTERNQKLIDLLDEGNEFF